jgi:hypothetical protein
MVIVLLKYLMRSRLLEQDFYRRWLSRKTTYQKRQKKKSKELKMRLHHSIVKRGTEIIL